MCEDEECVSSVRPRPHLRYVKTTVSRLVSGIPFRTFSHATVPSFTLSGLPVQVRDTLLGDQSSTALTVPQSDTNKQWFAGQHDRQVRWRFAISHRRVFSRVELAEGVRWVVESEEACKSSVREKSFR